MITPYPGSAAGRKRSHAAPIRAGDSVTELDAATGTLIRTVSGGRTGLSAPSAIAAAGGHLWVANQGAVR